MSSLSPLLLEPITPLQLQLTRQYITPNVQLFERAFYEWRAALDDVWKHGSTTKVSAQKNVFLQYAVSLHKKVYLKSYVDNYPIGMCFNITKIAFEYIHRFEFKSRQSPFYPIKEFVDAGGIFKVIWGEVRHEVFQTALQIGNWCFDTANDTVIESKPKVLCFTFDAPECEFYSIISMNQYLDIVQPYHQCKMYINNIFPALLPYFPLIQELSNGKLSLVNSDYVRYLMKLENFSFLKIHTLPSLSKYQIEHISRILAPLKQKYLLPYLLEVSEFDERLLSFKSMSDEEIKRQMAATKYINFLWV